MNDADIIKALEWCELFTDNIVLSKRKGEKFTFALQSLQTIKQVLKDYNRQKAEIEQLNHKYALAVAEREANVKGFTEQLKTIKAEAITEFEQKVFDLFPADKNHTTISRFTIKQIAKELKGEQ